MLRFLGWFAVIMTAILVAGSLTAYAAFRNLYGDVVREDVTSQLGARPVKHNKALNILLIGADTRNGSNSKYGRINTDASDTTILLHISPKRDGAVLVSFPRDSMVQMPACKGHGGKPGQAAHFGMINEAYALGGPGCTWKTIEALTGIHLDHFVKVDMAGFKRIVDALGGVEVCLPTPVNDPKSKLRLSAGRHVVKGETALAYVRTRYGIGDGSDLGRIKRQQLFLASVIKKAMSSGMLGNPGQLYEFLSAAAKSVTIDADLSLETMKSIAESMKDLSSGKVRFLTVPNRYSLQYKGRVEWTEPAARQLFEAIKFDNTEDVQPVAKPTVKPADVRVKVLNGTGRAGLATQTQQLLQERGFQVVNIGSTNANADRDDYEKTTLRYGEAGRDGVATLQGALAKPAATDGRPGITSKVITLIIGADWPEQGTGMRPPGSANLTKKYGGINANANICKAQSS